MLNLNEIPIGWFVGILDGEGSFGINRNRACIRIYNTDLDIIEGCEQYLKQNNIYFATYKELRTGKQKDIYIITIRESINQFYDYSKLLYDLIENKLECRKEQYQSILNIPITECVQTVDIDWLVGVYEAESSISMILRKTNTVDINITVQNTNFKILSKIGINLRALGCEYKYNDLQTRKENWKPKAEIVIRGVKNARYFLEKLKGKWISERNIKRTSLILEFIRHRTKQKKSETYTDIQYELIEQVKNLNF